VAWGREVGSSLLDNVIKAQGRSIWVVLVIIGFLIGGFCSYPLNMYPVTTRLESLWMLSEPNGNDTNTPHAMWKRTALRTGLVFLALILAIAIPSFGLFISLIGSLFSTALAFVFPTLFHMKLFSWPSHWPATPLKLSTSRLRNPHVFSNSHLSYRDYILVIFDIVVFVFGILATIVCTVVSVQNIVTAIQNGTITWSFQSKGKG
jgi:amino acid permease